MPDVNINYWAVIVAALVNMVVGFIWYSPVLFAKPWMKLTGKKMDDASGNPGPLYALTLLGALLQAYILAHFVQYTGSANFMDGLITGFWLWLGFVAVTTAVHYIFEGRSWKLWQINTGYFLVVLLINGGLLAAWQ